MGERSAFAGGDLDYLRVEQYGDSSKLGARASLHERFSTAEVGWFAWLAALVDWPAGGEVADVGCGPGYLWAGGRGLVPADLRLTLSDLSPAMVAEADEAARSAGFEVVATEAADHGQLPFADDAFDVVVANHTLFHAPDPARSVAELARVLRPGGTLLASTVGPDHLIEVEDVRAEVFGQRSMDQTASVFGRTSGLPILDARFDDVAWHQYPDTLACTDADAVLAVICSTPPAETASPAQLSELRAALDARFAAGHGTFRITKDTGAFVARGRSGPLR